MYAKREIPAPFSEKTTPFPQKSTTPEQPQQTTDFSPLLVLLLLDLISAKS